MGFQNASDQVFCSLERINRKSFMERTELIVYPSAVLQGATVKDIAEWSFSGNKALASRWLRYVQERMGNGYKCKPGLSVRYPMLPEETPFYLLPIIVKAVRERRNIFFNFRGTAPFLRIADEVMNIVSPHLGGFCPRFFHGRLSSLRKNPDVGSQIEGLMRPFLKRNSIESLFPRAMISEFDRFAVLQDIGDAFIRKSRSQVHESEETILTIPLFPRNGDGKIDLQLIDLEARILNSTGGVLTHANRKQVIQVIWDYFEEKLLDLMCAVRNPNPEALSMLLKGNPIKEMLRKPLVFFESVVTSGAAAVAARTILKLLSPEADVKVFTVWLKNWSKVARQRPDGARIVDYGVSTCVVPVEDSISALGVVPDSDGTYVSLENMLQKFQNTPRPVVKKDVEQHGQLLDTLSHEIEAYGKWTFLDRQMIKKVIMADLRGDLLNREREIDEIMPCYLKRRERYYYQAEAETVRKLLKEEKHKDQTVRLKKINARLYAGEMVPWLKQKIKENEEFYALQKKGIEALDSASRNSAFEDFVRNNNVESFARFMTIAMKNL